LAVIGQHYLVAVLISKKWDARKAEKYRIDRADCAHAEYDDTADHTEPCNNNSTITDQKQGDPHTQNNTAAITPEQAERIAQSCQAALERADERRQEQQESSGAVTVTAAAVAAAGSVEDRVSGEISGSRVSCEDGSECPDEANFPQMQDMTTWPTT
jgi:hypothetical protein